MNVANASKGPNWALLLLVPAAVIIAKGVRHRRAMWESGWTPSGVAGRRHGHHGRFGGDVGAAADSFRLPPKIEWMLDTWHTRAHQKADAAEDAKATASETETA
jgi:hypothetical protein